MNLKEIKQRILSIKGTQKITSAMKLVSSAKLRRAQSSIEGMRPYQKKLHEILATFLSSSGEVDTPYTCVRDVRTVVLIAVASDSSLCGAFNSNVIRLASKIIDEYVGNGIRIEVVPIGRKMLETVKKLGMEPVTGLEEQADSSEYKAVAAFANELMAHFANGNIDRVELVYTRFHSVSRLEPVREYILPFNMDSVEDGCAIPNNGYIIEPGKEVVMSSLLPKVIALTLYTALLDSAAAEHAARMVAMQVATENADELIASLTLEYNKGRQQAITNELLDIMSGKGN